MNTIRTCLDCFFSNYRWYRKLSGGIWYCLPMQHDDLCDSWGRAVEHNEEWDFIMEPHRYKHEYHV